MLFLSKDLYKKTQNERAQKNGDTTTDATYRPPKDGGDNYDEHSIDYKYEYLEKTTQLPRINVKQKKPSKTKTGSLTFK